MPTYNLIRPIRFQGKRYKVGDPIEVTEAVAIGLRERKYIPAEESPKSSKPKRKRRRQATSDVDVDPPPANEPTTKPGIDAADV